MDTSNSWFSNSVSALIGAVAGLIGTILALRNTALMVQATVYGDLLRRVSDLEANRDAMGELIFQKDRALITASQQAIDDRAGRALEKARADRYVALSQTLQQRLDRLESAVREVVVSSQVSREDRERLLGLLEEADSQLPSICR